MNKHIFETLVGTAVLAVAIYFAFFAYNEADLDKGEDGYSLQAKFDSIGGLGRGSDVRISGLKIGSVTSQQLDPVTYQALVTFNVDKAVKIPTDSSAKIVSDGLLGGKYLELVPGADDLNLSDGDLISYTQSSVNLEELIGKFAFGSVGDKADDAPASGNSGSAAEEEDPFKL